MIDWLGEKSRKKSDSNCLVYPRFFCLYGPAVSVREMPAVACLKNGPPPLRKPGTFSILY